MNKKVSLLVFLGLVVCIAAIAVTMETAGNNKKYIIRWKS